MTAATMIRDVLLWCTIINVGIFAIWFLAFAFARDWMHRFHGRWFRLGAEEFDSLQYRLMGTFKLLIIVFNLVPLIALWCTLALSE